MTVTINMTVTFTIGDSCYTPTVNVFLPQLSLRQRRHYEATTQVIRVALDLFGQQGYRNTTITQIAHKAGISEATFYRWFGTKEGIIAIDPLRSQGSSMFTQLFNLDDLDGSIDRIAAVSDFRGMEYVVREPTVRAAIYAELDIAVTEMAAQLMHRDCPPLTARALARATIFGVYFGSLEQWHYDGRTPALAQVLRAALDASGLEEKLKAFPSVHHQ